VEEAFWDSFVSPSFLHILREIYGPTSLRYLQVYVYVFSFFVLWGAAD
jgi:hypothetical protein